MTYQPEHQHRQPQPPQPTTYHYPPAAPVAPAHPDIARYIGPGLGVLGALTVIAGSLMPWGTIHSIFGTITVTGTDGDGIITLVAGVLLAGGAVLTAAVQQLWLAITQTGFAVAIGALGLYELFNVASGLDESTSEFVRVSIGAGLYVLLLGAALAFVGAFLHIGFRAPR